MDFVFIVIGHYYENGKDYTDILLVTRSEDRKNQYLNDFDSDAQGYYKLSQGTFDIE